MTVKERIASLRKLMEEHHIDAYIVLDSDEHISEYPPDHYKERRWVSGFTGSAGTVVITADKAGLWTDGRYYLQAGSQLAAAASHFTGRRMPALSRWRAFSAGSWRRAAPWR